MTLDFNENIVLENARALLRPLEAGDAELLLPVATQTPTLVQYSPFKIHTRYHLREYIATSLEERAKGIRYPFVIFDKKEGSAAGSTSIGSHSAKDLRFEIGWTWIGTAFQRTGLNRQCKWLLLSYAFDSLQYERVEFRTDERNRSSRRAMESMGAVYEGCLRSHTVMNDGFRRNTLYYSILRQEWDILKEGFTDRRLPLRS